MRFSASHSTKASELASMASRSRMSAVALASCWCFCSVMSTAMPTRWIVSSDGSTVTSARMPTQIQ